jgi:hypothetical protein
LLAQLKESLGLLDQLKVCIARKHDCYDGVCGRVQASCTPKQSVRFLLWLAKNYKQLAQHIPANYPQRDQAIQHYGSSIMSGNVAASGISSSSAVVGAGSSRNSSNDGSSMIHTGSKIISSSSSDDQSKAISLTSSLSYMATPSLQGLTTMGAAADTFSLLAATAEASPSSSASSCSS